MSMNPRVLLAAFSFFHFETLRDDALKLDRLIFCKIEDSSGRAINWRVPSILLHAVDPSVQSWSLL